MAAPAPPSDLAALVAYLQTTSDRLHADGFRPSTEDLKQKIMPSISSSIRRLSEGSPAELRQELKDALLTSKVLPSYDADLDMLRIVLANCIQIADRRDVHGKSSGAAGLDGTDGQLGPHSEENVSELATDYVLPSVGTAETILSAEPAEIEDANGVGAEPIAVEANERDCPGSLKEPCMKKHSAGKPRRAWADYDVLQEDDSPMARPPAVPTPAKSCYDGKHSETATLDTSKEMTADESREIPLHASLEVVTADNTTLGDQHEGGAQVEKPSDSVRPSSDMKDADISSPSKLTDDREGSADEQASEANGPPSKVGSVGRAELVQYLQTITARISADGFAPNVKELKDKIMPSVVRSVKSLSATAPAAVRQKLKAALENGRVIPNFECDIEAFRAAVAQCLNAVQEGNGSA